MRHGKKFNHLSRTKAHREAMLSNMACSLIQHKRINTTLAKAKALRKYIEPLITKSKTDTTHSRRVVFSYLQNKEAASELFREVAPKINDRPGGYTRIIKLNNRLGDNAQMAMIELVDFNELLLTETSTKKKTRRRRGGKKKADETPVTESTAVAIESTQEVAEDAIEETAVVQEEVKETVEVVEEKAAQAETAQADEVVEEKVEEEVKAESSDANEEAVEAENSEEKSEDVESSTDESNTSDEETKEEDDKKE